MVSLGPHTATIKPRFLTTSENFPAPVITIVFATADPPLSKEKRAGKDSGAFFELFEDFEELGLPPTATVGSDTVSNCAAAGACCN
jgi:hypothetical protein